MKQNVKQKVKITITMEDVTIKGKHSDHLVLDWVEEISAEQAEDMALQWISSRTFLEDKMPGLESVGDATLSIDPVTP